MSNPIQTPDQVIVVGSYNRDLLFRTARLPAAGDTVLGAADSAHGGKGFNQAVASARLGTPTRFIGAIGNDDHSRAVRDFAAAEGIDARWQLLDDAATGLASVVVDDAGLNQIVVAPGANARLTEKHVIAQFDESDMAVLLVQMETALSATAAALDHGREQGWLNMLNPAPVHDQLSHELVRMADVVTPNEREFAQLVRRFLDLNIADDLERADDQVMHGWCRRLEVDTVVVTLGKSGCFVSHAEDSPLRPDSPFYRVPGVPVTAVDTTGAGDCFNGALAAGMVRLKGNFPRACRFANRAASISVTRPGATPSMPHLAEIDDD